ncbi:MAG: isopeptide-forming domain-containing fimbrial protein [Eubacterium sp.]|nr:isopeptide-forming domain-containing fimbrial protein [Eubacterium sp.]
MKKVTRFFSLLLAIAMVLAMNFGTLSVMAGNGGSYKITINGNVTGHTYSAYQIFSGDLSKDANSGALVLSNIKWGSGISDTDEFLKALKASTVTTSVPDPDSQSGGYLTVGALFASCTSAQDVADVLAKYNTDTALAKEFADIAGKNLSSTAAGSSTETDSTTYTITDLTAGYYLVKDTGSVGDNDAYTDFILEVVGDATADIKSATPEVEKKVADINDSTDSSKGDWQDSADYDIGDDVPFQLTATVASNYSDYSDYVLTFHDVQSEGLTFNNDVKVTVDGNEIDSSNYVVTYNDSEAQQDGCTFEIKVTLKDSTAGTDLVGTGAGKVVVTYTSELNEYAKLGSAGNPNTVQLEYSNNPNDSTDTGKTTKDTVTVFTFELLLNKTDSTGAALKGAGFTLYKLNTSGDYVAVGSEKTGVTSFAFTGLDDGLYKIEETTTPAGYNTIDPIYFTVTAAHETTSDDPQLVDSNNTSADPLVVTVTDKDGNTLSDPTTTFTVTEDSTGAEITTDNDGVSTVTQGTSANITADVVNKSGAELPETGGMGTKIFYTLGGVLVIGAGVLLIVKRRMRNA